MAKTDLSRKTCQVFFWLFEKIFIIQNQLVSKTQKKTRSLKILDEPTMVEKNRVYKESDHYGEAGEMELFEHKVLWGVAVLLAVVGALHMTRLVLEVSLVLLRHIHSECRAIHNALSKLLDVLRHTVEKKPRQ